MANGDGELAYFAPSLTQFSRSLSHLFAFSTTLSVEFEEFRSATLELYFFGIFPYLIAQLTVADRRASTELQSPRKIEIERERERVINFSGQRR